MAHLQPDTSHWQVQLTPARARQAARRVDAFLFKATESTNFVDPEFHANVAAARSTRLPVGAYHFVRGGSAAGQASFFLRTAGHVDFVVIDWEDGDRATAVGIAKALKHKFHGPVIEYRGAWAREHGGDITQCDAAMVPSYGPSSLAAAYKPKHLPLFAWQYTDGKFNGTHMPKAIPGIGPCDVSVVYQTKFWGDTKAPKSHKAVRFVVKGKDKAFRTAASAFKVAKKVLQHKGTTTVSKKTKK